MARQGLGQSKSELFVRLDPLVPPLSRQLPELANRNDDAQPFVGAVVVALAPHPLHHLARLRGRIFAWIGVSRTI